jgi:hypothetical protein
MKTTATQSVVSESKKFIKEIEKLLPEEVTEFHISHFGMQKTSGYGIPYNYVMDVCVNGEHTTLKSFTHDSLDYDFFKSEERYTRNYENWAKRRILSMLESDLITEKILELV